MTEKEPDYAYNPNDWESTYGWSDRDMLVEGLAWNGVVHEFATLIEGPPKFAAYVAAGEDEPGEWQWFDSEEAARAAVKSGYVR